MRLSLLYTFSLCAIALLLTTSQVPRAFALDFKEVGLGYGQGIDASQWIQMNALSSIDMPWLFLKESPVKTYLDLGLSTSKWREENFKAYHLTASAVFRTQTFTTDIAPIFFEASFGPHLISKPGKTRRLSTAFEFNSMLGMGLEISPTWQLLFRARHLSNAGIAKPNSGVNLYLWQFHYRFRDADD